MKSMKVAVITPSYNDQRFVANAIESVINQSHKEIRHYIYSDASTDNSIDIIKSYASKYNQYHIIGSQNQGQAHGRNTLINQARNDGYEVLAFLDSDDIWSVDHIEKNLPYLESHDVVYSDPEHKFENGEIAYPMGFVFPTISIPKSLLYKNYIFISTVLTKMSMFDNVEFDNDLNSIEDWDAWCQLYEKDANFVKNFNNKTVIYIVKSTNSSSLGPTKQKILENKRPMWNQLRLNIGTQIPYLDNYINISVSEEIKSDCCYQLPELPYQGSVIHEIIVSDLIEKLGYHESAQAIKLWYDRLLPSGRLIVRTPDFMTCCQEFICADEHQQIEMYRLFFGDPYNNNLNKFLFTEQQLRMHLSWANFKTINRIPDQKNYLTLEAIK